MDTNTGPDRLYPIRRGCIIALLLSIPVLALILLFLHTKI